LLEPPAAEGVRGTTGAEAGASAQATTPAATPSVTTTPTGTAGETSRLLSTSTCAATATSTTEGPYYVTGTAALIDGNLNAGKLPGDPIGIAGYVSGGTGKTTPLADAVVDIWHADGSGAYQRPSNGPAGGYSADQLCLRGHVVTDAKGYYGSRPSTPVSTRAARATFISGRHRPTAARTSSRS